MKSLFKNREEAALLLAKKLERYRDTNALVLAIPRGGVPIGKVIAEKLNIPLDIVLSKKIGHPFHEEYAVGAVSEDDYIIDMPSEVNLDYQEYFAEEINRLRQVMKDRYKLLRGNRQPLEIKNKIVILTDDGIATGNTIMLAVRMAKRKHAAKIIIAVPVIAPEAEEMLQSKVDEIEALLVPYNFMGVGQFYKNFDQLSDAEVIEQLK
jgi:putative phosphoribosyl transferase